MEILLLDGRKREMKQKAAFFGRNMFISAYILTNMVGVRVRKFRVKESTYIGFRIDAWAYKSEMT